MQHTPILIQAINTIMTELVEKYDNLWFMVPDNNGRYSSYYGITYKKSKTPPDYTKALVIYNSRIKKNVNDKPTYTIIISQLEDTTNFEVILNYFEDFSRTSPLQITMIYSIKQIDIFKDYITRYCQSLT